MTQTAWVEVEPGVEILSDAGPWAGVVDVPALRETGSALVAVGQLSQEEVLATFAEWMRLDVADGHASPETLRAYMADVKQHLEWLDEEGLTLADVEDDDLKMYRAWLVEIYKISTAGRKLASVRRFYEMAHARGKLPANPAARLKSPRDKTDQSEKIKYLTFEAVKRILAQPMRRHEGARLPVGLRDRCILSLMAMHGLRVIEVHRLNLMDFDAGAEEFGTLRVFGKGSKYRTIILTEESRRVLDAWLAARRLMPLPHETAAFVTLNWNREEGELPGRLSRRAIRRMVDRYLVQGGAKREGISCHALRHSYATLSLALGADLYAISASMGHASITTTQVYAKIVDRARSNPARLLGGLLED